MGEPRSRLKGAERDKREVASIKALKAFGYALAGDNGRGAKFGRRVDCLVQPLQLRWGVTNQLLPYLGVVVTDQRPRLSQIVH